jgi:YHS domain-containing protein
VERISSLDDGRVSFSARPPKDDGSDDATPVFVDPVCAGSFPTTEALAASEYDGRGFLFCSHECKEEFDRRAAEYVSRLQHWDGPTLEDGHVG